MTDLTFTTAMVWLLYAGVIFVTLGLNSEIEKLRKRVAILEKGLK